MNEEIILLELFSGTGGFAKGIDEAGFKISKHYFSEVDKHAIANYKYNFKNAEYIGSVKLVRHIIRTINANRGKRLFITFGSPCQDFSVAGNGKGLDGSKSSLIKYAIVLIKWLKPDVFIWENVKGAFSTNDGADYWAIIQAFTNLDGYRCESQLLNTAWFLPQNRERIYLVGHLRERSGPGIFPIGQEFTGLNERTKQAGSVRTLTAGGNSGGLHSSMTLVKQSNLSKESGGKQPYQQNRVYESEGIAPALLRDHSELLVSIGDFRSDEGFRERKDGNCPTLQARAREDGSGQPILKIKPVLTPNRLEKRQNGRRFKEDGEPAFTLGCQDHHGIMINDNVIRRLTEIECERLQGFPDNWTKFGNYDGIIKEIPKTQRYKMCGNAVTVAVVKAVASKINLI